MIMNFKKIIFPLILFLSLILFDHAYGKTSLIIHRSIPNIGPQEVDLMIDEVVIEDKDIKVSILNIGSHEINHKVIFNLEVERCGSSKIFRMSFFTSNIKESHSIKRMKLPNHDLSCEGEFRINADKKLVERDYLNNDFRLYFEGHDAPLDT